MRHLHEVKNIEMLSPSGPREDDGTFYCEGWCEERVFGSPKIMMNGNIACVSCWEIEQDKAGLLMREAIFDVAFTARGRR